jgi:RNA polymerase sigma-70 factor (ECF subfamily)
VTAPTREDPVTAQDARLLAALRAGDERAFAEIVDGWGPAMLRVARTHVPSRAVAEEVVQETWLGVLRGLDRFEGRSSLKTWVFRILVNRAKTRGEREGRTVPFAALASDEAAGEHHAVEADRFLPADHDRWPHHWATPPRRWDELPEPALADAETVRVVKAAIAALPPVQRLVITMRDLEGFGSEDVCQVLEVSETYQRVLLHRARSKVRAVLEEHLGL